MSKYCNAALIKHRPKPPCSKLMGIIMIRTWPCSGQIHSDPEDSNALWFLIPGWNKTSYITPSGIDHLPENTR